jgi:hypothetical protein
MISFGQLWDRFVRWWQEPSPEWMQKASSWVMPATFLALAFGACSFIALVIPYTGSRRFGLTPYDPNDTVAYAIFRFVAGGTAGVVMLLVWWRKVSRK